MEEEAAVFEVVELAPEDPPLVLEPVAAEEEPDLLPVEAAEEAEPVMEAAAAVLW